VNETQEYLAIALEIQRWQGENAAAYIAELLSAVALAGDAPGIARWQVNAAAYDQLQRGSRQ
jgi:hypothetical protein